MVIDGEEFRMNPEGTRAVAREQPDARAKQIKGKADFIYISKAKVAKKQTGKASGWTVETCDFQGRTEAEAIQKRELFIEKYMRVRSYTVGKRPHSAATDLAHQGERQKRMAAAAVPCMDLRLAVGPRPGQGRAGPGRGHTCEAAAKPVQITVHSNFEPPLPEMHRGSCWLERLTLKKQWQTKMMDEQVERIRNQEELLIAKDAVIGKQAETIMKLRDQVSHLRQLHYKAAEEVVSLIKSDPVTRVSHMERLEKDPEWALVVGLGYQGGQRQTLIYKHLSKLLSQLRSITTGDAMKAKALSEMLYNRTHQDTGRRGVRDNLAKVVEHRRDVAEGIANSIRLFVHALHDAGGDGRYPQKVRQAMQVVATAVCRAVALSKTKTTLQEVGDALGLDPKMISKCKERFDSLDDGEWEQLFDDGQKLRSDVMDDDWVDFARQYWTDPHLADENDEAYNFTRAAESTSKVVRDPKDRKGEPHRIHWLEESVGVIYNTMIRRGKQMFGNDFHMSWPYFLDLRPFFVKDATRETCMCIYHLRFDEMANGLLTYRRTLRQQKISHCACKIPSSAAEMRRELLCTRREDNVVQGAYRSLDNKECMLQICEACKDLKKLFEGPCGMCEEETRDPGSGEALKVKFESYEKIKYTTKDGTEKDRKDFVSRELPFSHFKKELSDYWPKFIAHHNDAKWHDDDFVSMRTNLPRGHAALVIDFAENYSHQPRFEHQSKYFSQVQTTIVPVVVMLRIEDVVNIDTAEKTRLLQLFGELRLPNVVTETHFLISSDMQHDNALIQKGLDDHIIPYLKAAAPTTEALHIRSDGCKAQFKCASNFFWVSRQSAEGCGLRINWSFFASCHGKCYCDPEGGTLKNAARHHELTLSIRAEQLKTSEDLFDWLCTSSGLATPKISLFQKKGRGIFRRRFYWIPSKGAGAVNRRSLPKWKAEGTSRLHEFMDIGVVGTVSTRRAACHRCDACWEFKRGCCLNSDYVGSPLEIKISQENLPAAAAERIDRAARNRDAVERAKSAQTGSLVCVETHKNEQMHPWVIGKVVEMVHTVEAVAHAPQISASHFIQFESIRANDVVLKLQLYEALDAGSSTYFLSQTTVLVPARSVRVVDVVLVEARASARIQANSRMRYKLEESSLSAIRAEMPTTWDEWEVEKLLQYRCVYGVEQWLVKWIGFRDDRCTWEPWDSLATPEVQAEAHNMREAALREVTDLSKLNVLTLRAVLAHRGLDSSGLKAALVKRVVDYVLQS